MCLGVEDDLGQGHFEVAGDGQKEFKACIAVTALDTAQVPAVDPERLGESSKGELAALAKTAQRGSNCLVLG